MKTMLENKALAVISACITQLRKIPEIFKHIERKANLERLDIVFNEIGTPAQHRAYIRNLYSNTYDIVNSFYEKGSEHREKWQDHGLALFKLNALASMEENETFDQMAWRFTGTAHKLIDLGLFQCCTDYKLRRVAAPTGLQRYILQENPEKLIDQSFVIQTEFAERCAPATWELYQNLRTIYPDTSPELRSQWGALVSRLKNPAINELGSSNTLPDDFAPS